MFFVLLMTRVWVLVITWIGCCFGDSDELHGNHRHYFVETTLLYYVCWNQIFRVFDQLFRYSSFSRSLLWIALYSRAFRSLNLVLISLFAVLILHICVVWLYGRFSKYMNAQKTTFTYYWTIGFENCIVYSV